MTDRPEIAARWQAVRSEIQAAAARSGRIFSDVQLVAVSKRQSAESMNTLRAILLAEGYRVIFGESYVQEFKKKKDFVEPGFEVHLIGPLQSNKIKDAVALFDVIESVHDINVLRGIDKAAGEQGKQQGVLLQVNVSHDPAKKGFPPDDIPMVVEKLALSYRNIRLLGLMTITRQYDSPEEARGDYMSMRRLRDGLQHVAGNPLELSMGMSDDFTVAIEEGATLVRIGTALFGAREPASG